MSKVLVIGDSCTDVFVYGDIDRIAPEAPVPVIKTLYQKENPGMAAFDTPSRTDNRKLAPLGIVASIEVMP